MKAEILITGDEIRSGSIIDTNSAFISNSLEIHGIEVTRHTCIGDSLGILSKTILEISNRTNIAIITGGLGPTTDDITVKAAAKAFRVKTRLYKTALVSMQSFFKKIGLKIRKSDYKQALLPEGSICIPNDIGTAPGFSKRIKKCTFFFIPGVPHEAEYMLIKKIIPKIIDLNTYLDFNNRIKTLSLFGLSESTIGEKLSKLETNFSEIKLGICARFPQITLFLYNKKANSKLFNQQLNEATQWIENKIGRYIISTKGESLEEVIGNLLKTKKATLALAESCTGGLIADSLTNVTGSSDYFHFSAVTYSNISKITLLGVKLKTIETCGAVHKKTAEEMAICAKIKGNTTYGLSTSGIAGPLGGTAEKPVGTVFIGFADPNVSYARRFFFPFGDKIKNKKIFAITALDLLRRELISNVNQLDSTYKKHAR